MYFQDNKMHKNTYNDNNNNNNKNIIIVLECWLNTKKKNRHGVGNVVLMWEFSATALQK